MTVDYDVSRRAPMESEDVPLADLAGLPAATVLDAEDSDTAESYELPGADLSDEELVVGVVPKQPDEFTCGVCFLVHHRSRLARGHTSASVCTDCA